VPVLPAPDPGNYYRVLADHVLAKALPVLSLYPDKADASELKDDDSTHCEVDEMEEGDEERGRMSKKLRKRLQHEKEVLLRSSSEASAKRELEQLDASISSMSGDASLVYLKSGYAVDARHIKGKVGYKWKMTKTIIFFSHNL
jgi:hypothetical protein